MEIFNNLNGIDTFILIVMLLSALFACFSGFLREVLSIIGWVAAFASSMYFAPKITFFNNYIQDEKIANIISIITIFLAVLIFFMVISYMISSIVLISPLGFFDRLFGLLFGVIRGVLLLSIAYILACQLIEKENFPTSVKEAKLLPIIEKSAKIALNFTNTDKNNIINDYQNLSAKTSAFVTETIEELKSDKDLTPKNVSQEN